MLQQPKLAGVVLHHEVQGFRLMCLHQQKEARTSSIQAGKHLSLGPAAAATATGAAGNAIGRGGACL